MSAHASIVAAVRRLAAAHPPMREGLTWVMQHVNELERQRAALAEQVASGFPAGSPDEGAEQVVLHEGGNRTLRDTLSWMAAMSGLTAGGVSTLHLPAGEQGPLLVGHQANDLVWAPYLLAGRTLRIVGPTGSSITGAPAISVHFGAGDCSGLTIELWRVAVQGAVQVLGHRNVTVRPLRGAAVKAKPADPIPGVPL